MCPTESLEFPKSRDYYRENPNRDVFRYFKQFCGYFYEPNPFLRDSFPDDVLCLSEPAGAEARQQLLQKISDKLET